MFYEGSRKYGTTLLSLILSRNYGQFAKPAFAISSCNLPGRSSRRRRATSPPIQSQPAEAYTAFFLMMKPGFPHLMKPFCAVQPGARKNILFNLLTTIPTRAILLCVVIRVLRSHPAFAPGERKE
jgi:hypothetical protein